MCVYVHRCVRVCAFVYVDRCVCVSCTAMCVRVASLVCLCHGPTYSLPTVQVLCLCLYIMVYYSKGSETQQLATIIQSTIVVLNCTNISV